jgi:hypothetical protein
VYKQAFAALLLGALSFALNSASCVTCPKGQSSCGDAGVASGDAGATGFDAVECPLLTAMRSCMDSFCKTTTNPFCTCYKRGFDLTTNGCKCIDFDAQKFCDNAENNGVDASAYDCGAASSGVSSYCVGVN